MSIFDDYYLNNSWGNPESVSGNGSTIAVTKNIRHILPDLFRRYGIDSVVDLGCGDMNWAARMQWPPHYIGCDIVPELVTKNTLAYPAGDFRVLDVVREVPPKADLIFIRDVLVHLNNSSVQAALRNIRASGSRYLMATTFPKHNNEDAIDIVTGEWRPLNLQQMWGLPRPELLINEGCPVEGYEDKSLGMWRLR